jgi:hypothetical protein
MREVFASINYVINKLEEKNLFKIAQEGHDIFAAVYRFVGQDGELVRPDDDKSEQYYESAAPSNMFENDLYSPMDKNKQRKWRVKSEVPSEYGTAPSSTGPSATETPSTETFTSEAPSAGPSVTPESASVTVTTPSSYSGTDTTSDSSESSEEFSGSSSTSGEQGSGPVNSAASFDPSKIEYIDPFILVKLMDKIFEKKSISLEDLVKESGLSEDLFMKAQDILFKMGLIRKARNQFEAAKDITTTFNIINKYFKYYKGQPSKNDDIIDLDESNIIEVDDSKLIGDKKNDSNLLPSSNSPKMLGEKVYPTSIAEIQKNQEKLDNIVKNLDKILYMGDAPNVKFLLSGFLKNKELIDIVSDPEFEYKYSVNSNTMQSIEFIPYPGASRVGLKIGGNTIIKPAVSKPGTKTASAKKVLSMTNTFITNLENYGLKREADAMHDVFVKIANAYDLVNRPGVSVQAKKWIQDNVANIDAMTNLQLVNMMANLPLNVQTELKQIITNYKNTQGYKQNKPMGYQQPNQQMYQQGYQQGYQQQNMYQNQGGMVRPQ